MVSIYQIFYIFYAVLLRTLYFIPVTYLECIWHPEQTFLTTLPQHDINFSSIILYSWIYQYVNRINLSPLFVIQEPTMCNSVGSLLRKFPTYLYCVNVSWFFDPLSYWWEPRLLPVLGYCKLCCCEHWGA